MEINQTISRRIEEHSCYQSILAMIVMIINVSYTFFYRAASSENFKFLISIKDLYKSKRKKIKI